MGLGASVVGDILEHHGIKGMRWGVRKASRGTAEATPVTLKTDNGRVRKAEGGKNHPTHDDAKKAIVSRQKASASGTHALSNEELTHLVNRMGLEQRYAQLSGSGKKNRGQQAAEDVLINVGKQHAAKFLAGQLAGLAKG